MIAEFIPALLIPIGAGAMATLIVGNGKVTLLRSSLVNPLIGADLAANIPGDTEDEFILNAWQAVGSQIQYEHVGSRLQFSESADSLTCERCQVPQKTMARKRGNCVAKAAMLASMLRSALPADRVYMVIGDLDYKGIGGHAWVQIQRTNGVWYILESTKVPDADPWLAASGARDMYIPYAFFNDETLPYCQGAELCVAMGCPCLDKR